MKTSVFTVRRAYHALWDRKYAHKLGGDDMIGASIVSGVWGAIWKLSCLSKVKNSDGGHYMVPYPGGIYWLIGISRSHPNDAHAI